VGIWRPAVPLAIEEKSDFRSVWRVPFAQRSWGPHGPARRCMLADLASSHVYARAAMLDCLPRGEAPFASDMHHTTRFKAAHGRVIERRDNAV
jgi:hypothetical protein